MFRERALQVCPKEFSSVGLSTEKSLSAVELRTGHPCSLPFARSEEVPGELCSFLETIVGLSWLSYGSYDSGLTGFEGGWYAGRGETSVSGMVMR